MVSGSRTEGPTVPCDFCSHRSALLFCRPDSAKLCLLCDRHVHSANLLSLKHIRSRICHNCGLQPVSVRCSSDNLFLCHDCDWDAHGNCPASASHVRSPVDGFSGCPSSAFELAALLGLDLDARNHKGSSAKPTEVFGFQDLIVPSANNRNADPGTGRNQLAILEQLSEMFKQNVAGSGGDDDDGGGENMIPMTPKRDVCEGNIDRNSDGAGEAAVSAVPSQHGMFTSLLMMPGPMNMKGTTEGDTLWDSIPGANAQIWDFDLGRSRDHEGLSALEDGYGTNNAGFTIKSYGELTKKSSFTSTRFLEEMYQFNSSLAHEDVTSFNLQNNNPATSQGPATSESNNLPIPRPSSNAIVPVNPKGFDVSMDKNRCADETILVRTNNSGITSGPAKADMDRLTQHKDSAMLRYKEKKKTRRYDKHIRYESRKARADTKKRIKGRFVKAT